MYTFNCSKTFKTLSLLLIMSFTMIPLVNADDNKTIKNADELTEAQREILKKEAQSFKNYQLADCSNEDSFYTSYLEAKKAFSATMMPPAEVTDCCETAQSSDDAEEVLATGSFSTTDNILGIGNTGANGDFGPGIVALRFDCYNIPQGAEILSAYIQFTAANESVRGAAFTIYGEDADDCATYDATTPPSTRVTTSSNVSWSPPTWVAPGDALAAQQTPDLSSIVQEIVNRPGYATGNALCFQVSGKGFRQAYSFDSGLGAPELCVTYEVPEETTTCPSCPDVSMTSLDGVPGFPTVDLLNVCSEPDTVSLLIYNTSECDLTNVQLTLNLDPGLTYGGCVMEHYGTGVPAGELDVSDPSNPVFLITQIDSAAAYIVDICIKADCDVDINSENPLNLDANLVFTYPNDSGMDEQCDLTLTEIGEYNGGVRIPVLNILDISPQEITIPNTTSERCQTLTISQDGIQAQLSQYTLEICGLNLTDYGLGTIRANGTVIDPSLITVDQAAGTAMVVIEGDVFIGNTGGGANGDNIFDVDERMTIQVCYTAQGCTEESMVPEYKVYYGCAGKICFGITSELGAVRFTPNFGASPVAVTSDIQYGSICGDDLSYTIDLSSANNDPVDGLWQDLLLKYNGCVGNGMEISDITVGGQSLDPSLYSINNSTIEIDFTANTDPAYGLTDEDGDGFLDDLAGDQNLIITTSISIGCSDSMASCSGNLACNLTRIEVNGKRNCGQDFQQFANLSEPVSFFYGNGGSTTNAVPTSGYGIPITEIVETTCDVWTPTMNGYEFSYTFDSNNIGHCADSGGIKFVATITGGGDRVKHVRFQDMSATYEGMPVPGAIGYPNTIDIGGGLLDTISYTVEIPAGDSNLTDHNYYFNLEYEGQCFPWDYMFLTYKVVEECNSCTDVDPCEIVRACDNAASYVRWRGCGCVCDIRAFVDTIQRCNFGYADKSMTTKLTAADVPTEDLQRFLPGDTMYARIGYEVLNSTVYYEGDFRWLFDVRYRGWEAPLIPDVYNANFLGWFHEDVSAGTPPQEIGTLDCFLDPDYADDDRDNYWYPSMEIANFGVEGSASTGDNFEVCPDDDINPNYPPESAVNYRIYDMSSWDDVNDLSRLMIHFKRSDGCTSATPDELSNTCHQDLLDYLDLEDGDFFYIDLKVPLVRNPNVELNEINGADLGSTMFLYPYADTRMATPGTCSSGGISRTCRETYPFEGHLPGPVSIATDVCVTDCNTEVEYTFALQNALPEVDPGVTPWYENEYRPFMATEYLDVRFPSNMVYLDNGVIVMPDDSEVSFSPFIDTNVGNLNCIVDGAGNTCCIAADPMELAGMRIVDNDYTIGQSQTYYRGPIAGNNTNDKCDVQQLIHVPNDPFPHLVVGGTEGSCSYGIKYSLSSLCPEDIESSDFQLDYQFADPYVPSLPGVEGPYNSSHHNSAGALYSSNARWYPVTQFGTNCNTYPNASYPDPWGCIRHYENIVSNPDDSPGNINPMRQTGSVVTSPDNFADKSLNFPPLLASIQNTLIADEAMMNEVNTYTVCSEDNGVDMGTHTNVVTTIEIPTTIELIDVCDENGTPVTWNLVEARPTTNLYSVINPDLAVGECFEIQIKTELLFCPVGLADVDVEMCLTTVSGCIAPDKAALFTALGETQCDAAGACYEYIAEEAEIQAEWSCNAVEEYQLCDTLEFGIRFKNVRPTLLIDLEPEFWFPNGMEFVPNSFRYIYPGGVNNQGAEVAIPDPVADPSMNNLYGTYYTYADDADWAPPIDMNGLPGVGSSLDSNQVEIKFKVITNCEDFVSGTSIWFRGDAADPCEARVSTGFVPTFPVIIDGANPSDFAQFFVFADPLDATCGEPSTITLNFLNISPTGVSNNSMACMDIETSTFMYMMGSVQWLSPAGHNPMFTEEMNGAITHLCFDIPDGIGPGQAFQISFMFEVPEDVGCGEQDLGVNVSSTVMNSNCMAQGIACDVQVLNSVNPSIQVNFNPPVEVADQTITVGCGNGDGTVPLCYDVDLANNSSDDYVDDVKIKLIRDLNQNGILEDFDPPLDSAMVSVNIASGDTLNVMGCFDVDENIACPVFLMVMQETNCVCDAQDFYYDSIEPAASDELNQSIAICPGAPLKIGYCGDWDYSVSPSAGAVIEPNAAGDSLCITLNDGYGLTNPVVLNVASQTGGCMEFNFDTEIYSLGDFTFENYEADTACNVGCIALDLNLPTEYRDIVTVQWTPSTYLSDATSQTPTACDVASDITYTVTVNFMENGQMCEFSAEYPIIVEEQQTNALFDQVILCSDESSTVVGPPGFTNYNWYEVTPAGNLPIQSGTDDSFTIPSPGVYYLEYYSVGDACFTLSEPFDAIPCPTLIKSFVSAEPTANENEYTVCYEIAVDNNSDLDTEYDLYDLPSFDDDITIISASYTSTAGPSGTLSAVPPAAPGWLLGNDVQLVGLGSHIYNVCVVVQIDLTDGMTGDDTYTSCGSGGGGGPLAGEGLFNEASLDVDESGMVDSTDDACGELPFYTIEKTITSINQTSAYTWTVQYDIVVCNEGGGFGSYDLNDVPGFDDDITIVGASFSTDAFEHPSNPGPTALAGTGPWDLADQQEIEPAECQTYTISVDVMMNIQDASTPGDGNYSACGENGGAGPVPGEGLYNEAQLDTNGDGNPNQTADDCGDLPSISHEKALTSITQTGARSWEVKYTITVENEGGASGMYDLEDEIAFDDDIVVTCVNYTSDATGNANNPGPTNDADLAGPWTLADDQNIDAGVVQTYCITFCVDMDLNSASTPGDGNYDPCAGNVLNEPMPGEGLYNQSSLDLDNDGTPEETDEACGDLPNVYIEKTVTSFVAMANGNHMVTYEICAFNNGGADGMYDLYDTPAFDDDIMIIAADYNCTVGGNGTLPVPVPAGGWLLLDDQDISPGAQQCCTIDIEVTIDMSPASGGDNMMTGCGSTNGGDPAPGEALYNAASLDLNNDGTPDETDDACQGVFEISHVKSLASITQNPDGTWCVLYNISVSNTSDAAGFYDLNDFPQYDDDITIVSAEYASTVHPLTTLTLPVAAPGWSLANDVNIQPNATHVYTLTVCVDMDLEDGVVGNDTYTECGAGASPDGSPGEGLFNESYLDINNDGVPDETDEACGDLPYLTLSKTLNTVTQTGPKSYDVEYIVEVCNTGGAADDYDLWDQPSFDDDVVINSASFTSDAAGNAANPGPVTLPTLTPWDLATTQNILPGVCHQFIITVNVTLDLTDAGPGDNNYIACGTSGPGDPMPGEGLYNQAVLDEDGDGNGDETAEDCGDLPAITHEKTFGGITQTGPRSWEVKYDIEVLNNGGAAGVYDLNDMVIFDDDVVITCARYTSDAPGNPGTAASVDLMGTGPWNLADDQSIDPIIPQNYCLIVCVDMDIFSDATPGDGVYSECGNADPSNPTGGEGLFNQSSLDFNNDGMADETDEACGDLPAIRIEKSLNNFVAMANGNHMVTYTICVYNEGGASGLYDLNDLPQFDDDIEIIAASYTSTVGVGGTLSIPVPAAPGWNLDDDQTIPAGETYCYDLNIEVDVDLSMGSTGDNVVTECGETTGGDPSPGEALYNGASLDLNNDGTQDDEDSACEDVFNISNVKTVADLQQQPDGTWCITYNITVENRSQEAGFYDLYDVPDFDNDFTILSAEYSSTVHPTTSLAVPVPAAGWQLANDELLEGFEVNVYVLTVCVDIDLEDGIAGDDLLTQCGAGGNMNGSPGEGLFNQSQLDINNDGTPDRESEACADIPYFTLDKSIGSVTQTGPYDWTVTYEIEVCNIGTANGDYDLIDTPSFDDDIVINAARYSTDASGNPGNPGPTTLVGNGPWTLGDDMTMAAGACSNYTVEVDVTFELNDAASVGDEFYEACGAANGGMPMPGEGLYNEAALDTNNDGVTDIEDEACADLPIVTHEKEFTSITQTGPNSWDVKYTITVSNTGGTTGNYTLTDDTAYDNDITITCANYTSDVLGNVGNPGPFDLGVTGPWTLASTTDIDAGEDHVYCLIVCVDMDLNAAATPGDGTYSACGDGGAGQDGQPGEGLYNMSMLDLDSDGTPDEEDEACGDLPHLYHTKSVSSFTPMPNGNHMVVYEICVTNDGGADGNYDLYDYPQFDDDITIISAQSSCDASGVNNLTVPPAGPNGWLLEDDITIAPGTTNCCMLEIEVNIDVAPGSGGDNVVSECGAANGGDPSPGEALFNQSSLDMNNDGTPDEVDEACEDVFNIDHEKELLSVTQQTDGSWCATYEIVVTNRGNEDGFYDLYDLPQFDDDFTILSAEYSSSVHPVTALALPVPTGLGWQLGNDEALASQASHTYNLVVCVDLNLEDGGAADGGDDVYTACGDGGAGPDGEPGEGLYNISSLDSNNDGIPDQQDEACGDVPYFTLEKDLVGLTQIGPRSWTVEYSIDVCNIGGALGIYDLTDTPCFDDDVVVDAVRYSTDAPSNAGNPGPQTLPTASPWLLGDDEDLSDGSCHAYSLFVDVTMDLTDPSTPGDEAYTACGDGGIASGTDGEGVYNKSALDTNNDGTPDVQDDACGDIPHITHEKELTSISQTGPTEWEVKYTITVTNDGGLAGTYDLNDDTSYDDDVIITCANYTSDAAGNAGNPAAVDLGTTDPWTLADDQSIEPGTDHVYCLIVCVDMDLNDPTTPGDGDYDECGANGIGPDGEPGEGLYNQSQLDLDNDGTPDEEDEACGDLPHIYHEKQEVGFAPMANGNNMVTYEICVYNDGGADGDYDLYDFPQFDDDIEIISGTYTCDNNVSGVLTPPVPNGGWLIVDDETLSPGESHCCTVEFEVDIDLSDASGGDNVVTECGTAIPGDPSPGEALYNESGLDLNNDGTPDEMDEACEDVFAIQHTKTIADLTQTDHNEWCITYNIVVNNMGMEPGFYDLYDWPQWDDDIVMTSARYNSTVHAFTNLSLNPTSATEWQFADDVFIGSRGTHVYTLDICFSIDLEDGGAVDGGDDFYTACGDGGAGSNGQPGEGLFNQTFLDTNDDGVADETDEVCADIPYFTLNKSLVDVVDTGAFIWDVTYEVEVCNVGGAAWEYSADDTPCFDTDIVIQNAEVSTNAPGHSANPGPQTLFGTGPWVLAEDQNALPDACHTYTIVIGVWMNLNDPNTPGDGEFSYCADINTADPNARGGLYNKASLDDTNDSDPDVDNFECAELPYCEELEGVVFYDLNNNGCQDDFETAIAEDVEVTLYECGENGNPDIPIATTTTINGEYNFGTGSSNPNADVCPAPDKTYRVEFNLPNGDGEALDNWNFSSNDTESCAMSSDADNIDPSTGSSECFDPENDDPTDGDDDEHIDVGIYPCQDLSGVIFYDLDNDGCQEAGETNVAEDVTVNLYECGADGMPSGTPVATATAQNGEYEFGPESTTPGGEICLDPSVEYIVEFEIDNAIGEPLAGWEFSSHDTEVCADAADADDINPSNGQSTCYDPNEDDEWDNDPSNDDGDGDVDAGIFPCQDISGEIFWDIHNNGCEDQGDQLVTEDVTVEIFECDASGAPSGLAVASTTVSDGMYEFSYDSEDPGAQVCLDPSKQYAVQFSFDDSDGAPLEGQDFSTGEEACADATESDDIDPDSGTSSCFDPNDDDPTDDDDDNHVDAGINPCEEISGEVFVDTNNNGCQDNGESLVDSPINVSVFECGQDPATATPVASTQTIDGAYEFGPNSPNANAQVCLEPTKQYFVVFEIPQMAGDPYEYYQFSSHDTETCANGEDADDIDPTTGQSGCYDPENGDDDLDDDGDEDNHIDAGIFPCQNLAGEVFYDMENNGCEDNNDTPVVEDVTVNLYECDASGNPTGPSIASTQTIGGQYEFGPESVNENAAVCLDPSKTYYVEFDLPNAQGESLHGWEFSLGSEMCAVADESDDIDPSTGQSGCFDPNEDDGFDNDPSNDDADGDIDAGIYPCQDVTGEIFWDINNNGCQDNGESLVTEDVTVEIFECAADGTPSGPAVASTTVNDGMYEFSHDSEDTGAQVCLDPSKTYVVQFNFDSTDGAPLEGQDFSTGEETCADASDADDIDPDSGLGSCVDPEDDDPTDDDDDNHVDAGINPCEEISGEVFVDTNNNGCQDNGESLVDSPINVSVFECGQDPATATPVASTQTIDGAYEFGPNSPNANAQVCLEPTKQYFVVFEIPQMAGDPYEYYQFSSHDTETCANGEDADDIDPTTGQSGCYDPENGDDDLDDDGDEDNHIDAGIFPCQNLAGEVFYDMENNGCEDNNDTPVVEDVTVNLYECDASGNPTGPSIASTQTIGGQYEFGPESVNENAAVCLDPSKTYYVEFDLPNAQGESLHGWEFSLGSEMCAVADESDDIDPSTGQSGCFDPNEDDGFDNDPSNDDADGDIDAGIYPCQDVTGEIFWDINNNGCQDNGESLVTEDVTVEIFECAADGTPSGPAVASTTVNDGMYEFSHDSEDTGAQVCLDPSKTYVVQFNFDSTDGAPLEGQDFSTGEETCANASDADDIDPDSGLGSCVDPEDDDPTDDDDDNHVDAGINPCEEISGEVFVDTNNNGCQDNGESLVDSPINVSVFECGQDPATATPVASTQTIDGAYEFGPNSPNANAQVCLEPTKQYFVVFEIPQMAGDPYEYYQFSSHDTETCANGEDADDIDPTTGQSGCYDPENGDDDLDDDGDEDNHIDAGIFPCQNLAGEVFYDMDNNGCEDNNDTPVVEDVTVNLYECDASGNPTGPSIASTQTIGGQYEFGPESVNENAAVCLDPSKTYYVEFDLPNAQGESLHGWEFSLGSEMCAVADESDDIDPSTGQSGCFDPNEDDGFDNDPSNDDADGDIDAGIYPCQDVTGEIFWDINNNGCQDNGESLVTEDVTVEIFECAADGTPSGPAVASTTVNDGMYEFSHDSEDTGAQVCLDPSKTYVVQFNFDSTDGAPLEGQDFSTGEETCANASDADDIDPDSGLGSCVDPEDDDPTDDDDDNHVDAGINPCEEISGEVFVDTNNNGCQDNGESLVDSPINVSVFECGQDPATATPVASTQTIDGAYEFGPNSPNANAQVCLEPTKQYFVVFEIPQMAGDPYEYYQFSSHDTETCANGEDADDIDPTTGQSGCYDPENGDDDLDDDGDEDNHIDAGIFPCQNLMGEIFLDINNNGCHEVGEPLVMEDVTVTLFECNAGQAGNGTPVSSITTNDGEYEFGPASDDEGGNVCLDPTKEYYVVFEFDDSEGAPLQGHKFSTNETVCGDPTDADDIDPSNGQSGCYDPEDDDASDNDDDNHVDAGINPCQELGGRVFFDLNANGCQDAGEPVVTDDVTVNLFECDANGVATGGPIASTTTINGEYLFGEESPNDGGQICLESGKQYYVQFEFDNSANAPLNNFVFTNGNSTCAANGDADDVDNLTGASNCYDPDESDSTDGTDDDHIDAGLMPLAKLGDRVFLDCNGDGVDNGEAGIEGIRVEVYNAQGLLVKMTRTDANGNYLVTHLYPGQYYVKFIKGDYEVTIPNQGGNNTTDSDITESNGECTTDLVTLGPGECNTDDFDAGLYECIRLGELVWLDYNENDIWDPTENGINGIKVELYKFMNNEWIYYDYTYSGHKPGTPSDDGYFKFCVPPGRYYLKFLNPPATLVPAVQNFGINESVDSDVTGAFGPGTTDELTLVCGEDKCDIGAGYYKMGSIGDHVWMDNNGNGMRENGEPGLADVIVRAYDLHGEMLGSATTNQDGEYMIDYLGKNSYFLKFELPNGYGITTPNMGNDEAMDSDVDGSNGPMTTAYYSVMPGEHMPNVDAGVVLGVLSAEWLDIKAEHQGNYNEVTWVVDREENASHYEVERSIDNTSDFESIGKVLAENTGVKHVYTFDDYDVDLGGVYYYRVRQYDLNDQELVSKIVSVDIDGNTARNEHQVQIYPNPVVDELTLDVEVGYDVTDFVVNLFDAQGRLVRSNLIMDLDLTPGKKVYKVNVKDLAKGIYTIKVNLDRKQVVKKLIVIEQ